ncbi:FkbM family methyltransferase [Sphingomonas flavalba]|uniref:FkbM family methyltransferase n=1 Tax=Sphingomonas flavalba TaxID=2559804 RepID=UPI001444BAA2|nr:FkbM family methyltransferase [Sphingomonas flavalba]
MEASDRGPPPAQDLICLIARNRLGTYCIPAASPLRQCARVVAGGGVYEPRTIDFLCRHAGAGDIVHAGAFFGDFLPAVARALAPGARLWAFEPVHVNYVCAAITGQLNGLDNVVLTHAGLGDAPSEAQIATHDAIGQLLGELSYIQTGAPSHDVGAGEAIRIVRIDDIVPADRQVSVVQLDVEGFEEPALAGALATIRRCKPIILLENLPSAEWIAANLTPLGYRLRRGVHANAVYSVTPISSLWQGLRWQLRGLARTVIPNPVRRRLRRVQAALKARGGSMPVAAAPAGATVDGVAYRLVPPAG